MLIPITIDNSKNPNAHANVQIRVELDASFDFDAGNADGSDLRVYDTDGTTSLHFWIDPDAWDPVARTGDVWVLVPSIAAGTRKLLWFGVTGQPAVTASNYETTFIRTPVTDPDIEVFFTFDSATTGAFLGDGTTVASIVGSKTMTLYGGGFIRTAGASNANAFGHTWTGSNAAYMANLRNQYTNYASVAGMLDNGSAGFTLLIDIKNYDDGAGGLVFQKLTAGGKGYRLIGLGAGLFELKVFGNEGTSTTYFQSLSSGVWQRLSIAFPPGLIPMVGSNGEFVSSSASVTPLTMPDLSSAPFIIADSSYNSGMAFDNVGIVRRAWTPYEMAAYWHNSKYAAGSDPGTRLTRVSEPAWVDVDPTNGEPNLLQSPTNANRIYSYYSIAGRIGRQRRDLGGAWVDEGLISDSEIAGEHHGVIYEDGLYWIFLPESGLHWKGYSSPNGFTGWTERTTIALPSWAVAAGAGNFSSIFKVSGTWYAFFDCYELAGGNNRWRLGIMTATSLGGTWSDLIGSSVSSLLIDPLGLTGGGWYLGKWGGKHHMVYAASPEDTNIENQIYHATSEDLVTWTLPTVARWGFPVPLVWMQNRAAGGEIRQDADPTVLYWVAAAKTIMQWTACVQDGDFSVYESEYDGPFRDLFAPGLAGAVATASAGLPYGTFRRATANELLSKGSWLGVN